MLFLCTAAVTECSVAGKPLMPVIVGCVVWQLVQCSWTPSTEEQKNHTGIYPRQQILLWSRGYGITCFQFMLNILFPCTLTSATELTNFSNSLNNLIIALLVLESCCYALDDVLCV